MARSTRQQRRQRRAQAAGTPPLRPAPRPEPAEQEQEAALESAAPSAERVDQARSGIPFVRFVQEAIAELKKVEWPGQQAVVSGTAVVLVACVIVGIYLWANDQLWKYVVQHILIR